MYITIDIGGTNIRISSFTKLDPDSFIEKRQFLSKEFEKYGYAINKFVENIKEMAGKEKLKGIGISMTGSMNPIKGNVIGSDSFPYWEGFNICEDLKKELNCKVKIENDAVVAGLAERYFGYGKDYKSMGFVIVGTGVGAVRINKFENKDLIYPTEFGHIIIVPDGEKCICGQRGCLEAYASGKGFMEMYGLKPEDLKDEEAWIVASRYFAQGLMNFLIFHPVEIFIFGGGLAANQDAFLTKLMKYSEQMIMKKFQFKVPKFKKSMFKDNTGSVGGLALLMDVEMVNMNFV
ncbi:MAG: ROK family protein [Candidatus Dojkabacteria bacterium]